MENLVPKLLLFPNNSSKGATVYTDEHSIYNSLKAWGYEHETVCHGSGE
ncbi:MAG: transposase [Drouetiella hepatica Uher 2000/2452]|uniref:Transposase n=1 Tax=Drouetiella hepatica Uher 2000/2452 TaxID=904376 RepID=A0A951QFN2_9CYAN|nr:transposase [Drouetiella hepatica Uher 2000/2452]